MCTLAYSEVKQQLGEVGRLLPCGFWNQTQTVRVGSRRLFCQVILSAAFEVVFTAVSSNSRIFSSEISNLLLIESSSVFLRYCIFSL